MQPRPRHGGGSEPSDSGLPSAWKPFIGMAIFAAILAFSTTLLGLNILQVLYINDLECRVLILEGQECEMHDEMWDILNLVTYILVPVLLVFSVMLHYLGFGTSPLVFVIWLVYRKIQSRREKWR